MNIYVEPPRIYSLLRSLRHISWDMEEDVLRARRVTTRLSWAWEGPARDDLLRELMFLYRRWDNLLDEFRFLLNRVDRKVQEWEKTDRYYADIVSSVDVIKYSDHKT